MRIYRGERHGPYTHVTVSDGEDTRVMVPATLDQFEWGYLGAGPFALAKAIMADLGYPPRVALRFKETVIANLGRAGFVLTETEIGAFFVLTGVFQ